MDIFCVIAACQKKKPISSLFFFVHWPKTHTFQQMDDTTPSTRSQNNMGEPPTTLPPTTESPSVVIYIKIILWIYFVSWHPSKKKQSLHCFFCPLAQDPYISTMHDTTPSTRSQNNMGEPPTTLQPTTESPSYKCGYDILWYIQLTTFFLLTNFTTSLQINSHSFVTALLFDKNARNWCLSE